jgi:hypothetical protein
VDLRYEAYCFADRHFFDVQSHGETPADDFSLTLPELPADWTQSVRDVWRVLRPAEGDMPGQGWKIHASATPANAERVLTATHAFCTANGIPFKYLRTRSILTARNSKYAPRQASGKLVTIYPRDEAELERTLTELSARLTGEPGPYVLSDLRFGSGPLYVRYGGFLEQWVVDEQGNRVPAVQRPDGTLVPDERRPTFHVPDWVELPDFLRPHVEARSGSAADFPYQVRSSLHFSNGGGVYQAVPAGGGDPVVLKEARPHAGLDRDGTDAVTRLEREHDVLAGLRGVPGVPQLLGRFTAWEHHFLAMSHLPGVPLGRWLAQHYPLSRHEVTEREIADYTARALRVLAQIERIVTSLHERGVVFGDLHDRNVLIDEDDTVGLVDFELAFPADDHRRPALGAPGFFAPADRRGVEVDEYALGALRLWMFLPLNTMLTLSPEKLDGYVRFVRQRFALPAGYGEQVLGALSPRPAPPAPVSPGPVAELERASLDADPAATDWDAVRKAVAEAILASATPERQDRLFPGDIEQFEVGGTVFGCGAAGVLHALAVTGAGRYPEHEQWLVDTVWRTPPTRPGFYDGAHGIAHVLENFGHHDRAAELVEEFRPVVDQTPDHGLGGGLSGVALNLLHFADSRGDDDYAAQAVAIGDRLAAGLEHAAGPGKHGRAGLLHGWSGPALLFVHLFRRTGDRAWLDLADRALLRDLDECAVTPDGSLQVRDGSLRTLPYLRTGSAGIAVVANELAPHSPDAPSVARLPELLRSSLGEFVIQPGLLLGRGSLITALALAQRREPDPERAESLAVHLARLSWHAVDFRGGIAFPGNQLLRLSCDLGTGSAGVLLAVSAALDDRIPPLPFLGEQQPPERRPDPADDGKSS